MGEEKHIEKKLRKMASLTLIISLPKFGPAGSAIARRSTWNPRLFAACTPRPIQASSNPEASSAATDALKRGANEAKKTGETVKDKANSTAEHNTKDMAGKMSATAQDVTEKVKQTAQEAWGSAKDTAQKAKDNVLGKTEESKESIKESTEAVKKSMNTKN